MTATSLRFGRFELQPRERRLLVDGAPAALGARAFDLLVAMAARPGQLLTKSELLDQVWPGLVVEEANLSVQVSTLRKVLCGDLIATVPGRGYRFTGTPVSAGAEPAARSSAAPASTAASASTLASASVAALASLPGPATPPAAQTRVLIGRDA